MLVGIEMPNGSTHRIDVNPGETIKIRDNEIVRVILPSKRPAAPARCGACGERSDRCPRCD